MGTANQTRAFPRISHVIKIEINLSKPSMVINNIASSMSQSNSDHGFKYSEEAHNHSSIGFNDNFVHDNGDGGSLLSFAQRNRDWSYSEATSVVTTCLVPKATTSYKRPRSKGGNTQVSKKQCDGLGNPSTKSPCKDPQSIAAKIRRERIGERLKTLQELIPNGTKVDMVTMLEKAITYVKFLELQVTILATDELWPAQAGKAPTISQVKEAIDSILNSSSNQNFPVQNQGYTSNKSSIGHK